MSNAQAFRGTVLSARRAARPMRMQQRAAAAEAVKAESEYTTKVQVPVPPSMHTQAL